MQHSYWPEPAYPFPSLDPDKLLMTPCCGH